MRYLNGFLCMVLLLFAAVQYNDPDFILWFLIYALAAAWAGVAAVRPALLNGTAPTIGLGLSLLAAVAGTVYMWPDESGWWQAEVWWEEEPVREAMGLMIVTMALAIVALSRWLFSAGSRKSA